MHQAYRVFTIHDDTHPCLTERLQAMGEIGFAHSLADRLPVRARPCAADVLFGEDWGKIQEKLATLWRKEAWENWQTLRAKARVFQDQIEAQIRQLASPEGNLEALWEQARSTAELHGAARAEGLLRQVIALRPTHAAGNLLLGRHLLSTGDPPGEEHLERAMTADEDLVPAAAGMLSEHFTRPGEAGRVRELRVRLDRYDARVAASRVERNRVTVQDHSLSHGLAPETLEPARLTLREEREIVAATLVRKELKHFPEQRLFVLVVSFARRWYALPDAGKAAAAINRLVAKVHLPGRLIIVGESGGFVGVARKAKAVSGAKILDAAK